MPKRKYGSSRHYTKRRKTGRKKYRARRLSSGRATAARVSRSLMPTKLKRTFNYSEKITVNATFSAAQPYFFSANSLFDPNRTGTGHQPMGFDQFVGNLYDHYTVIACKITVMAMSQSTEVPAANQILSIIPRDTTTSTSDITQAIEQGRAVYGMLGSSDGSSATLKLSHALNPAKFLGRSKPLSDPDLRGTAGSNPAEECFFEISTASIDGDDPPAVDMIVTLQYTAMLTERVRLGQS